MLPDARATSPDSRDAMHRHSVIASTRPLRFETQSEDADQNATPVPALPPSFFVPRLDDKPQNPIMDTLRLLRSKPHPAPLPAPPTHSLPPELELLSEDLLKFAHAGQNHLEDIWQSAALERHRLMVS